MFQHIMIDSDLHEWVIFESPEVDEVLREVNQYAQFHKLIFKRDTSLFGGYFVNKTNGNCHYVK